MNTLVEDHKLRVARLLRGERRAVDIDRLFADLRFHRPGRSSVQEIGHFAAHRGERDKGIVLDRAAAIQTSARVWFKQFTEQPSVEDIRTAGLANLEIASEKRIKKSGNTSRQAAKTLFLKAVRRMEAGEAVHSKKEIRVINEFGLSAMWQFAFDDGTLFNEFSDLLVREGSLCKEDVITFFACKDFVTLHALSIMHGAVINLPDGTQSILYLSPRTDSLYLTIKADINVENPYKPTSVTVSLFDTSLSSEEYCSVNLLGTKGRSIPAEVDTGRLVALS